VNPEQLAEAIAALPGLPPSARAQAAKRLINEAKATLSTVRRRAITQMLEDMTYKQAAVELGVSPAAINAAVTAEHAAGAGRGTNETLPFARPASSGYAPDEPG
jgi:Sigma-70, region 4